MYWSQDEAPESVAIPDDAVDLLFALECRALPVDHAYALYAALTQAHPWLAGLPGLAVQSIHVAGSQNGWERPAHGTGTLIQLSRRTKLTLRAPRPVSDRLLAELPGTRVEISGHPLAIGGGKERPLSRETTLLARHVVADAGRDDEDAFFDWAAAGLRDLGVVVRKAMCGKHTALQTPDGPIHTRSLMLADLSLEESFRLQREGLGPHRLLGCGIFIPHKGIDSVAKPR